MTVKVVVLFMHPIKALPASIEKSGRPGEEGREGRRERKIKRRRTEGERRERA